MITRRALCLAFLVSIAHLPAPAAGAGPNRVSWQDLPARVAGRLVPLDKLGVAACPTDWALRSPDRRVLQIIENVLYSWEERDLGRRSGSSYCVVMRRPFERALAPTEAQVLLTASSLWLEQATAPGALPATPSLPAGDPRFEREPAQFRGEPSLDPSFGRTPDTGLTGWAGGTRTGAPEEGAQRTAAGTVIGDSVIGGTDDRARVTDTRAFPNRAIGFLSTAASRATAFQVSPYAALTNGHVVWDAVNREFSRDVEVAPGQYESGGRVFFPYGQQTAVRLATNPGWVATGKIQFDYGAVFFDQPFSGLSTFMPLAFDVKPAVGSEVRVAGYPGSVRGTNTQGQWFDADKVVSVLGRILRYKVDTSAGNSGSPVWQVLGGGQVRAIAVHSTGDPTNSGNSAARLVAENFDLLAEWLAWTPFQRNGLHLSINQVDADACPLVQANVSVTNDGGQPVLDLTRANFSLNENGVPQAIDVEQAEVSDQAISVALLLDASGSLSPGDVANIKIASRRFVDLLGPRDRIAVYHFANGVALVQGYTTDKARAKAAIDALNNQGGAVGDGSFTALFDAIIEAAQGSTTVTGRRAMVAMTDGMNNTGTLDPNAPIAAALAASVPVFTIGFGDVDEGVLDSIATNTGGRFFLGGNSADLQAILAAIGRTFDKQYLITWLSPFRSGGSENIEISVADGAEGDTRDTTYSQSSTLGCPAPSASCQARIVSPNGGDTWTKGQLQKITWSTTGPSCGPTVGLAVSDGSETWYLADVPDNGMRSFDIDFLPPGNLYRAIVADRATGQSDISDDTFSVGAGRFTCRSGPETLCLLHGRFEVRVVWRPPVGTGGFAKASLIGDGTGIFRFADPTSAEIGLRMFDSRAANGHFSFFSGAVTNFEYSIFVTDTVTGETRVYSNPAGEFRSFADDTAFGPPTEGASARPETPHAPPAGASQSSAVGRTDEKGSRGPASFAPVPAGQKVLWDQSVRTGTTVISSENRLDPGAAAFDTEGADDFVVPTGKTWMLDGVDVAGDYYGPGQLGPADSVDVQVYSDQSGFPGAVKCSYFGLHPARGLGDGDFEVNLPSPCRVLAGRSWVKVQAEIDFNAASQWGWAERQPQRERPSVWRNPGGGYQTFCDSWGRRQADCGVGENPDFAFRLRGRDSTGGGTGNCQATTTALCFANRKVKVEVTFRSETGRLNPATARTLPALPTSGYFSFGATGLDVLVKILDGSTINGNLWVFYGGLSSLEFTVKVTDVTTGRVRTYTSPKGRYTSAGDIDALPGF